jgi:hypothetical protein
MVYRTYSKEENDIVRVYTPTYIQELNERGVRGFDTRTYEPARNSYAAQIGIEPTEYDAVAYIDNALSICRRTSGWDSVPCEEHVENRVLYRCFFCHREEQGEYCQGVLTSGRRCSAKVPESSYRYLEEDKYCDRHLRDREEAGYRFSLNNLDEWLDGWQRETVMLWKRSLIKRLTSIGNVAYDQLIELKSSLDKIKSGELRLPKPVGKTHVYFIHCDGYVKIGRSDNPERRFADLCRENDTTIRPAGLDMSKAKILGTIFGSRAIESHLHGLLFDKHVAGEWFHYDTEVATLIESFIGDGEKTVEWLLEDVIKNYENIISHDVQGGWDYTETSASLEKKSLNRYGIERREKSRQKEYGF